MISVKDLKERILSVNVKMIKVIFLDFDGVLIPVTDKKFNMRNVDNLNELIRKTDAKIVITSDWKRDHDLEFIEKTLTDNGVRGEIIDITPNYTIKESETVKVPRGTEIDQWIKNYETFDGENLKAVLNYVILDDHMDMLVYQLDHFVEIDQSKGFDGKALKDALEIMTKNNIVV
jgi:NADH/NAD ratio-sensing transcriptional regulator Rex